MFDSSQTIAGYDPKLAQSLAEERVRQEAHIELIASENYTSPRVLEAQGSVLTKNTPKAIHRNGTTVVVNLLIRLKHWQLNGPNSYLVRIMQMCNPILVRQLMQQPTWR